MPPRLPEIDIACQLADDQEIQPRHDFRFQCGSTGQFRIENGRTEIGEQFQILAQSQNGLFRAKGTFQRVVFEITDGTKQNRIGFLRQFQGGIRQGMTMRCITGTADIRPLHFEIFIQRIQNPNGFIHDFRTDTVARQNCNLHVFPFQSGTPRGKVRLFSFL